MERYSMEAAENEAMEIRKKAQAAKAERSEVGEPSKEDYQNAGENVKNEYDKLLKNKKEAQERKDWDRANEIRQKLGIAPADTNYSLEKKEQSSRRYAPSEFIKKNIAEEMYIFDETKKIKAETKVCLIGDGQGADTRLFLSMGVNPKNIEAVNYEAEEIDYANNNFEKEVGLKGTGVEMKKGDATKIESLKELEIEEKSQDIVTLMHVLEVPDIKGETEENLIKNLKTVLKSHGEMLVSQYKERLTLEQAKKFGVEEIKADNLEQRFGSDWRERFKQEYGKKWCSGMLFSEISRIRPREELLKLFEKDFVIKVEENDSEYILRMKRRD